MNNLRDKKLLADFGKHIKQLRLSKKFTLEALSYEANMELSQIHRIEKGYINPTLSTLKSLAEALKISLSDLMDF